MAEGSVSETLDHNPPSQSPATPLSPSSTAAADPSLSRSGSFSGLNAKAPEFVPSSPRPQTTQQQQQSQQRIAIPPPPPHGVVHVYPPYHGPHPLVPLHHYSSQVPVWFHPQQQQHGQYQSAGGDQEASLNKGGDHHQQGHNNQNHSYHHHHHRRRQQVQGDQDQAASSNGMSDETVHKVLNQVRFR
ncbi:hypothetical protein MLD38_016192 [Melastoma candidum]|uniref:Uncharacterized protein n=1 Tax=Melastoma candidum TaxID=119954 RepID=A0ACB9RS33_9MYRT|nr:hypothetical protein MLD38_016192 [Melastoma candidum]